MNQDPDAIRETVRKHYAERVSEDSPGYQTAGCCTPDLRLYPAELLDTLPQAESVPSYGCGDPITLAGLVEGQTVLDLGSGAGLDCFFAAKKVGSTGRVIGVDMTPEMIERAQQTARRLNMENVEFRKGLLEELPVEDSSIDVVISNCVINLAPNKARVFNEIFRVLKPGGLLSVSDIVTDGPLPEPIKVNLSAWAGCIAGALDKEDYRAAMAEAGLMDISLAPSYFDDAMIEEAVHDLGPKIDLDLWPREAISRSIFSARITARKP